MASLIEPKQYAYQNNVQCLTDAVDVSNISGGTARLLRRPTVVQSDKRNQLFLVFALLLQS